MEKCSSTDKEIGAIGFDSSNSGSAEIRYRVQTVAAETGERLER